MSTTTTSETSQPIDIDRAVTDAASVDRAVMDAAGDDVEDRRVAAAPSLPLRLVIWYQRTFAGGPPTCRFYPSCSSYAREALEVHGTTRGVWLSVRRLARCRPFGPSGVDPVPPRSSSGPAGSGPSGKVD